MKIIAASPLTVQIASTIVTHNGAEIKVNASFGVAGFTATKEKEGMTAPILLEHAHGCLVQARADLGEAIKGVQLG